MLKTCGHSNIFDFWKIFIKFGEIVGEVKMMNEFDTSGATYSFTKNMNQNALKR